MLNLVFILSDSCASNIEPHQPCSFHFTHARDRVRGRNEREVKLKWNICLQKFYSVSMERNLDKSHPHGFLYHVR